MADKLEELRQRIAAWEDNGGSTRIRALKVQEWRNLLSWLSLTELDAKEKELQKELTTADDKDRLQIQLDLIELTRLELQQPKGQPIELNTPDEHPPEEPVAPPPPSMPATPPRSFHDSRLPPPQYMRREMVRIEYNQHTYEADAILSDQELLRIMSNFYPELINAEVIRSKQDGTLRFVLRRTANA